MTKQEIVEYYGRSVYEIRLDLAMRLFGAGYKSVKKCLELADQFVAELQNENGDELEAKFP
jgi:hypothetical protein